MEAEEGAIEGGGDEELDAVVDAMDEKDLFDEPGWSICYLAMTLSHFCNESDMFLLSFWKLGVEVRECWRRVCWLALLLVLSVLNSLQPILSLSLFFFFIRLLLQAHQSFHKQIWHGTKQIEQNKNISFAQF